jgi:hypothetical protein
MEPTLFNQIKFAVIKDGDDGESPETIFAGDIEQFTAKKICKADWDSIIDWADENGYSVIVNDSDDTEWYNSRGMPDENGAYDAGDHFYLERAMESGDY